MKPDILPTIILIALCPIIPVHTLFSSLCATKDGREVDINSMVETRSENATAQQIQFSGPLPVYGSNGLMLWSIYQWRDYIEAESVFQYALYSISYNNLRNMSALIDPEIFIDIAIEIYDTMFVCGSNEVSYEVLYGSNVYNESLETCKPVNFNNIVNPSMLLALRISQQGTGTTKVYEIYENYVVENKLWEGDIWRLTRVRFTVKGTVNSASLIVSRLNIVLYKCYEIYILPQRNPMVDAYWNNGISYHTNDLYKNSHWLCGLVTKPGVYNIIHKNATTNAISLFKNFRLEKVEGNKVRAEIEGDFRVRRKKSVEMYTILPPYFDSFANLFGKNFQINRSEVQMNLVQYAHRGQCRINLVNTMTHVRETITVMSFEWFNLTQGLFGTLVEVYSNTVATSFLGLPNLFLENVTCYLTNPTDESYITIGPQPVYTLAQELIDC